MKDISDRVKLRHLPRTDSPENPSRPIWIG